MRRVQLAQIYGVLWRSWDMCMLWRDRLHFNAVIDRASSMTNVCVSQISSLRFRKDSPASDFPQLSIKARASISAFSARFVTKESRLLGHFALQTKAEVRSRLAPHQAASNPHMFTISLNQPLQLI